MMVDAARGSGSVPGRRDPASIRVGVFPQADPSGNFARNIAAPSPGVVLTPLRRTRLPERFTQGWDANWIHVGLPGGVDLVHSFNGPALTGRPWVATFESVFPRIPHDAPRRLRHVLQRLTLHPSCRGLIAMSQWAADVVADLWPEDRRTALREKVVVVYPHQDTAHRGRSLDPPRGFGEPLRLLMVGADFVRKGGEALLELVERRGDDLNLHLTVISRGPSRDLIGGAVASRLDGMRRRLQHERIAWIPGAPRHVVAREIERAHLGVLPSLQETFGYVVLEFQAAGLPTVTTNVSALPELVSRDGGWLLELPLKDTRAWKPMYTPAVADEYPAAITGLSRGLEAIVESVRSHPAQLAERSAAATAWIGQRFSPAARAQRLRTVYERALS